MSGNADDGAARRERIESEIVARTGIDDQMIERVVHTFYGRVRRDPLIGPVFNERVKDWDEHLAKLCDFWASVALMRGSYHGQPMVVHLPLPIDTPHFNRWLTLFAETVTELCPPTAAEHFLERAHRIADSLEMGISLKKGELKAPSLRPPETLRPGTER